MSLGNAFSVFLVVSSTLISSSHAVAHGLTYDEFREFVLETFRQAPRARLRPTRDRSDSRMLKYTTGGIARDALPSTDNHSYATGVIEAIALIEVTRKDLDANFWQGWARRSEERVRSVTQRRNVGELDDQSAQSAIAEVKASMRQDYDDQLHEYAKVHGFECGVRPCPGEVTYQWKHVYANIEYAYFVPPPDTQSMEHMRAGDWNWFQFCKSRGKTVVEPQWETMSLDDQGRFQFPFHGPCTIRMQVVYTDGRKGLVPRFYVPTAQVYRPSN
jgi:hypothetical protein